MKSFLPISTLNSIEGRGKDKEKSRRQEKGIITITDMGRRETMRPCTPAEEQALTLRRATFVIPVREQRKDFKVQRKRAKGTFQ